MSIKSVKLKLKNLNAITAFDVNQAANLLAIGQLSDQLGESILSIFSLDSLELITTVETYKYNYIPALSFNQEGTRLFYATDNDLILMFDSINFVKEDWFIECEKSRKLAISNKGDKIISSGKKLEVWDIDEDKKIWANNDYEAFEICNQLDIDVTKNSWYNPEFNLKFPFIKEPLSACFTKNDQSILFCGGNDPQVFSLNLNTFEQQVFINDGVIQSREMGINKTEEYIFVSSFIPNGEFVWNIKTKERVLKKLFNEKFGSSPAFDFHPNKSILALGSSVGYVSLINLNNGEFLFSERLHFASVSNLKFYQDGTKIASSGLDGRVLITSISELLDKLNV